MKTVGAPVDKPATSVHAPLLWEHCSINGSVHLSQPKFAMLYKSQILSWSHNENTPEKHLEIILVPHLTHIPVEGNVKVATIRCDGAYIISIWKLKDDIKQSVTNLSDGYLKRLEEDPDLQGKFVEGVNHIYDPVISN